MSAIRIIVLLTLAAISQAAPQGGAAIACTGTAVPRWSQCGGQTFQARVCCSTGDICQYYNPYYSQCIPATTSTATTTTKTTTTIANNGPRPTCALGTYPSCSLNCPAPLVFDACNGAACARTCNHLNGGCAAVCWGGCVCPNGQYYRESDGTCVDRSQCPGATTSTPIITTPTTTTTTTGTCTCPTFSALTCRDGGYVTPYCLSTPQPGSNICVIQTPACPSATSTTIRTTMTTTTTTTATSTPIVRPTCPLFQMNCDITCPAGLSFDICNGGPCALTCDNQSYICQPACTGGCVCPRPLYWRKEDGKCVEKSQCPPSNSTRTVPTGIATAI